MRNCFLKQKNIDNIKQKLLKSLQKRQLCFESSSVTTQYK